MAEEEIKAFIAEVSAQQWDTMNSKDEAKIDAFQAKARPHSLEPTFLLGHDPHCAT